MGVMHIFRQMAKVQETPLDKCFRLQWDEVEKEVKPDQEQVLLEEVLTKDQ